MSEPRRLRRAAPGGGVFGLVLVATAVSLAGAQPARIVHVDARQTAARADGRSWQTAFTTLQPALDAAGRGGEVWVAGGTYRASEAGDRAATIQLRAGVALYGGFAGNEAQRAQRDPHAHETILTGDLGAAGHTYTLVTAAPETVLDGFTIRDADSRDARPSRPPAGGPPQSGLLGPVHTSPGAVLQGAGPGVGAGVTCFQCAPRIAHCRFVNNRARKGGALYCMTSRGLGPGGGEPGPTVIDCDFIGNEALGRGGAVANDLGTNPRFDGCRFLDNRCPEKGGAMYNDFGCSPTLTRCLFARNQAGSGGALANDGASAPVLVCCTFTQNRAEDSGAALYQGTGPANNPILRRCILWADRCDYGPAECYNWHDCAPDVQDCLVAGGWLGRGNSGDDPRFVDAEHGDFTLAAGAPHPQWGYTGTLPDQLPTPPGPPRPAGKPWQRVDLLPRREVVYVDARRDGDGSSWERALHSLQAGLDLAERCRAEVWVAAGTFKPQPEHPEVSFALRGAVAVYGGFAGTETRREERDVAAHATILSGDLGRPGDPSDNCYHVVLGADGARLDGFTITGGNADAQGCWGQGGGLLGYWPTTRGRPEDPALGYDTVVANCRFVDNRAREGGAVYDFDKSRPRYLHCTFERNRANYGGAMVSRVGVRAQLEDCDFRDNLARWRGGALYLDYGARPAVTNCRFAGNSTRAWGGAVYLLTRASQLEQTLPLFTGCRFDANRAEVRGGALACEDAAVVLLSGCLFATNQATTGADLDVRGRATAVVEGAALLPERAHVEPNARLLHEPVEPWWRAAQ